jgi:transcription antitermination factor NusA-like protein
VLCSRCEAKLKSGAISQDDVQAAIKLIRLADRNQEINKFTLVRGAKVNEDFVFVLRAPDVNALRANPELASKIENEMGQKVWFVETEASDRRFIENLFDPFRVVSVNFFWLPDSNKLTKVIVDDDAKIAPMNIEKVQKIAKAVRNMELLVEFKKKVKEDVRKIVGYGHQKDPLRQPS